MDARTRGARAYSMPVVVVPAVVVVVTMLAALVAGCSGATDSDSATSAAAPAAAAPESGGAMDLDAGRESVAEPQSQPEGGGTTVEQAAFAPRAVVVTVGRTVRVADVPEAVGAAATAARTLGGRVQSEDGTQDPDDPAASRQVSVLRVPPAQVEAFLTDVEGLGEVLRRTRQDTDVTVEYQDVAARLANAQASVDRVRQFYAEAKGVREIVLMESELSKRVADLEALKAQHDALSDVTELATVTVTFVGTAVAVPEEEDEDEAGFLGGLAAGWSGLVTLLVALATVLGAVLPFLPLVALMALLGWWGRRLVRRRTAAAAAPGVVPAS